MMMSATHGGHVLAGLTAPQTAMVALPHSPCRPIPGHLPHHPADVAASISGTISLAHAGSFTTSASHPQISPATHHRHMHTLTTGSDRYAPLKRLAMVQIHPPRNPNKPLTPFSISDILDKEESAKRKRKAEDNDQRERKEQRKGSPAADPRIAHLSQMNLRAAHAAGLAAAGLAHQAAAAAAAAAGGHFVRPWASSSSPPPSSEASSDVDEDQEIEVDEPSSKSQPQGEKKSPLDALLQMTSKTFDGLDGQGKFDQDGSKKDQLSLFSKSQPSKKRRKSRTAFTNQQIYELEKRFLYQKYLTPADRDEIAQSLGLSNAQVITWFQNRRAKLKRDLEELKSDLSAAKTTVGLPQEMSGMFGSLEELQLFQKQNGLKKTGIDKMKSLSVSVSSTGGSSIASPPSSCGSLSPSRITSSPTNMVLPSAVPSASSPSKQGTVSPQPSPANTDHVTPLDHVTSPASTSQHSPISNASDSPKKLETSSS